MKKYIEILFVVSIFVFSFEAYADNPFIKIISPNDAIRAFDSGQKIEIKWNSNVSIDALVNVYVTDGIHKGVTVGKNNNGTVGVMYTLDNNLVPGSNYRACISFVSKNSISDCSDNTFTIKTANAVFIANDIKNDTSEVKSSNKNKINQVQDKLNASLEKVQNRSGLLKFFIGSNYAEISNIKKILEQNSIQIEKLSEEKNKISNKNEQQKLSQRAQELEQANAGINRFLDTEQKGFSLFGWLFK